jgi:hypothetical protein
MDSKEVEVILRDLDEITKELNEVQREMTQELVSKISSIQSMIDQISQREIILEKQTARIILRDNNETPFEGLF